MPDQGRLDFRHVQQGKILARACRCSRPSGMGDRSALQAGPRPRAQQGSAAAAVAAALATRTRAEWIAALEEAGVPCSPVNDIGELVATDQFAAVDMVQALPESGVRVVGLPISFDGVRPHSRRPAPKPGEHTAEVLKAR